MFAFLTEREKAKNQTYLMELVYADLGFFPASWYMLFL